MLRYSPPGRQRIETTDSLNVRVAGAESNVATAASRLGAAATWISKLPDTPLGRRIVNFHRSVGLDTAVCWSDTGRVGTYYIEFGAEPRGTSVIYDREDSAVTTATPGELQTELIGQASMFQTSGITPALSSRLRQTTADLLSLAQESGTRTVFDLNYRAKLWSPSAAREVVTSLLPDIDVFVAAERDVRRIFERTSDPETIARSFTNEWDLDLVIITRGERGAAAYSNGEFIEQDVFETETIDPIGTGDAFVGGYIARELEGGSVTECLEWGAATAALKRTVPGDIAVITRDEVGRVIADETTGIDR